MLLWLAMMDKVLDNPPNIIVVFYEMRYEYRQADIR